MAVFSLHSHPVVDRLVTSSTARAQSDDSDIRGRDAGSGGESEVEESVWWLGSARQDEF